MEILISGASSGIGRACALALGRAGHRVWAGVRDDHAFERYRSLDDDRLVPILLDVNAPETIARAVSRITREAGVLHALVNNAGIAVGGPVESTPIDDWRRQFETNVFGAIALTQACLPRLRESRGRIVNLSSISGRLALPYLGPYAASKFALEGFSDSLRRELKPLGVAVALIEPGAIATPIWEKSISEGVGRFDRVDASTRATYGEAMDRFRAKLDEAIAGAAPAEAVARAVLHAVSARRPRRRYPVGRGIRLATALTNFVPAAVFDWMLS